MRQDILSYEYARHHFLSIIKNSLYLCAVEPKKAVLLSDELSVFNTENPVVPFIQGGTVADADDRCAG